MNDHILYFKKKHNSLQSYVQPILSRRKIVTVQHQMITDEIGPAPIPAKANSPLQYYVQARSTLKSQV